MEDLLKTLGMFKRKKKKTLDLPLGGSSILTVSGEVPDNPSTVKDDTIRRGAPRKGRGNKK